MYSNYAPKTIFGYNYTNDTSILCYPNPSILSPRIGNSLIQI